MADDNNFTTKVVIQGDIAGGKIAEQQLHAVSAATGKASVAAIEHAHAAREAGDVLAQLGSRGGEARHAAEGIEQAMRGGTTGVLGFARALFALRSELGAGFLTFFAGTALALIPTLFELGKKLFETGEEAKKSGEGMNAAAEAAEALNKIKLDAFKKEIDGIKERQSAMMEFVNTMAEIEKKLNGARKGAELSQLDLEKSKLSPEEYKKRKFEIEDRYARGDEKAEADLRANRLAAAETAARETAELEEREQADRDRKQNQLDQMNEEREAAQSRKNEFARLRRKTGGTSPEAFARGERMQELHKQIEEDKGATPTDEQINRQSLLVMAAEERAKQAEEAAKKARDEFDKLKQADAAHRAADPIAQGLEARRRRAEAGIPEPEPRPTSPPASDGGSIIINGEVWHKRTPDSPLPAHNRGSPMLGIGGEGPLGGGFLSIKDAGGHEVGQAIADKVNAAQRAQLEALLSGFSKKFDADSQRMREEIEQQLRALRR